MNKLSLILMNQYNRALKANHPNLVPYVDEKNLKIWYFLIKELKDTPFEGGEYIFKLNAPEEFPHKPPSFEFCTPNGVYDIGGKICISVGEFHANDRPGSTGSYGWRPSLGMYGFANEVLNGLINYKFLDHGIRILSTVTETKKKLAIESIEYNKKYYSELYTYFISLNTTELASSETASSKTTNSESTNSESANSESANSKSKSVKNEDMVEDEGELILLFLIENFN